MPHAGARTAGGLVALVVLWIVVYWLWQPGTLTPGPRVTFADARPRAQADPPPGPRSEEGPLGPNASSTPPTARVLDSSSPPQPQTVVPPVFHDYVVREGDTFEIIARRELGARSLWTAIARANPLRDPRRLHKGDLIRIPQDPTNVQGAPIDRDPQPASDPIGPEDETPIVYLVTSGDSLSTIAQAYYGSQGFAELIYQHNRDVLESMDDLSIGMQLRLPPVPNDE